MSVKLLAPKDAAKLLGVTTSRVQQLDREGRLKALRDSAGRRFYLEPAVRTFEAERRNHRKLRNTGNADA